MYWASRFGLSEAWVSWPCSSLGFRGVAPESLGWPLLSHRYMVAQQLFLLLQGRKVCLCCRMAPALFAREGPGAFIMYSA